jgi:hypothetical protein
MWLFSNLIQQGYRIKVYMWFLVYKRYINDELKNSNIDFELLMKPYYNLYVILYYIVCGLFILYMFSNAPFDNITRIIAYALLITAIINLLIFKINKIENSIFRSFLRFYSLFVIPKLNQNKKKHAFNKLGLNIEDNSYL